MDFSINADIQSNPELLNEQLEFIINFNEFLVQQSAQKDAEKIEVDDESYQSDDSASDDESEDEE